MKIIVQKFGGTSVQTEKMRERAVHHVVQAVEKGYKVVVVVSAMGRTGDPYATDTLLGLILDNKSSSREKDILMSCGETISMIVFSNLLKRAGVHSEAMTGAQAGFRTNSAFNEAKIVEMKVAPLLRRLETCDAVVVAGFQGQTVDGEITTLGRGGSDTSAAALGAAVDAEWIDIFTDVNGVMTADPRIVSDARRLSELTYNEVCNLAYQGAKVIHPRAVEIAMTAKIPIHIRSTMSDELGTIVTTMNRSGRGQDLAERPVTGITYVRGVTQIRVRAGKNEFNLQAKVFKAMAEQGISVDLINISPNGVVYTVGEQVTERAVNILKAKGYEPEVQTGCAKVSAVGAGMAGVPGVASRIVNALTEQGIQILQSADSHNTIWVLVEQKKMKEAVIALHKAFHLEKEEEEPSLEHPKQE
ncbi:aspartate kinase [Sporolactobacillus laevolacticus]|uniref:Aspartokinase n=1 Tax=Sporolactobacillus laevolacticus DSM 442 TaxID=1395513 RepID=V6J8A5_9BACL|nr:aspartate kinase [Sporolactobacillus laevolacticus]EST13024.1 aspartate kinase [Sporolactobacillus laevolacticus DSM 442]